MCLTCFNGFCEDATDSLHNHSAVHYNATSHPVLLNVRRVPKVRSEDEPPKKLTKLEIVAEEPENEKYDFHTTVHCVKCNISIPPDQGNVIYPSSLQIDLRVDGAVIRYYPRCVGRTDYGPSIGHPSLLLRPPSLRTCPPPATTPQHSLSA